MGYVDKIYRMSNMYSICRRIWKWTKRLFFHFLDLSVLLHKSFGGKLCHKQFREEIMREYFRMYGKYQSAEEDQVRLSHSCPV
jgi:hypothetical protein